MQSLTSIDDSILVECQNIGIGEKSQHMLCPACGGGVSREKSLRVTRTATGLYYVCYRASCGSKGYINSKGRTFAASKKKVPAPVIYPTEELTEDAVAFLKQKINITDAELVSEGILWEPLSQRIVFPCKTYYGSTFGYVRRKYPEICKDVGGKTSTAILCSDAMKMHFPARSRGKTGSIVVVEDIPSSIAVSRFMPAVALMGTYFSKEMAEHLFALGFNNLYIALDPDATHKAVKMSMQVNTLFDSVLVLVLDKDPKDMDNDELERMFGGRDYET